MFNVWEYKEKDRALLILYPCMFLLIMIRSPFLGFRFFNAGQGVIHLKRDVYKDLQVVYLRWVNYA